MPSTEYSPGIVKVFNVKTTTDTKENINAVEWRFARVGNEWFSLFSTS